MIELTKEELTVQRYFCYNGDYDKDGTFCTPFEMFTRYIFFQIYGKKFNVSRHHKLMFDKIQEVFDGRCKRLIINVFPRSGKTELAIKMAMAYGLVLNPKARFIHLAGGDDLALENSEMTRDYVKSEAYQSLFSHVQIKKDSDSKKKWYTTENGGVYATSAGGQVTGFGAGITESMHDADESDDEFLDNVLKSDLFGGAIIIDDPLKPEDAANETAREKVNRRYISTIQNRTNSRNTPIILIMQRLHPRDLTGFLLEKGGWDLLCLPAINEDGTALYPHKLSLKEMEDIRDNDPAYFESQYMQNPQPLEGLMYQYFKTYDEIPVTAKKRYKNYTDTADSGDDYLCSINYIETELGCYVVDVVHTKLSMESSSKLIVDMMMRFDSGQAQKTMLIESNNGGRIFATNIERDLRLLGDNRTKVEWFYQGGNKAARISNNRFEVSNMVHFPTGWQNKFPKFYEHLSNHRAEGQKKLDDAADCVTGLVENMAKKSGRILSFDLN